MSLIFPTKTKQKTFWNYWLSIDNAIVKGHNIILMGHYNINYLNSMEKKKLDSILLQYHLEIQNKTEATGICKASKTAMLIDCSISNIYVRKPKRATLQFYLIVLPCVLYRKKKQSH